MKFTNEDWLEIFSAMKRDLEEKKAKEQALADFREAVKEGLIILYSGGDRKLSEYTGGDILAYSGYWNNPGDPITKVIVTEEGLAKAKAFLEANNMTRVTTYLHEGDRDGHCYFVREAQANARFERCFSEDIIGDEYAASSPRGIEGIETIEELDRYLAPEREAEDWSEIDVFCECTMVHDKKTGTWYINGPDGLIAVPDTDYEYEFVSLLFKELEKLGDELERRFE